MPDTQKSLDSLPGYLLSILKDWLAVLTNPDEEKYITLISNNRRSSMLLGVLISAFLASIYLNRFGSMPDFILKQPLEFHFWIIYLLFLFGFFAANLLIFIIVQIFHASGSFDEQCTILSLLLTPSTAIITLLLWLRHISNVNWSALVDPFHLTGFLGALLIFFFIYELFLYMLAIRSVHQIKASEALTSLLVLVGIWAIFVIAHMFIVQQDTLITRIWFFIIQQWEGGYLQEALLGHFWLVLFSVIIASIIGIVTGVLITLPMHKPKIVHLLFVIPLMIFFLIWAATSGLMGEELSSQINQSVRLWDRSLRSHDGFWGEFLVITGSILRKPGAIGLIGMSLTLMFYILFLVGEKASGFTLYLAGIILTIPSIALFGVLIKPLGIGVFNAAFALILYAQLPILRNTYTGIKEIQPEIIEAGRGMGMTEFQLLKDVKLPLAVPVIMTGLRVSTVMLVGIAAIAAYIGTNTLGDYIFAGIQRAQEIRYITGAIVVAILALSVDYLLGLVQEHLTPIEYKVRRNNR